MSDVFVSYKREDRAAVRAIVSGLRDQGLDVWWDQDISPNAPWEATIEKQLGLSKAVVVAWSPLAITSDSVKAEARAARNGGRLVQVFVEPCEPPLFFGERQGIDLTGWRGEQNDGHFQALTRSLRAMLAGERPSDAPPIEQAKSNRFAAIAVAIALVAALGLANYLSRPMPEDPAPAAGVEGEQAAADSRAAVLARVEGVWGRPAEGDRPACTATLQYSVERRADGDYIIVRGPQYESIGRVASAEGDSVFTRTVTPKQQAGAQWELRLEIDRLIQIDSQNTPTPLVRC